MITASHNPKEYNGFKFSFSIKGNACGKEIYDFRDFLFKGNFRNAQGFYQEYNDNFESYINKITESIDIGSKKIKAVFDPGNGTGSIILERILKKFDIDYKIINGISDGNFPVHHPDPSVEENMQMLKEEVLNNHFDIALGIDGDADIVVCTDAGLASKANRKFNNTHNRKFITTQSIKKLKNYLKEEALDLSKGWHLFGSDKTYNIEKLRTDEDLITAYKDRTFYKERWIKEDGLEQRLIVTYSVKYQEYQRHIRNNQITRAKKLIENNPKKIGKAKQNDPKRFIEAINTTDTGEVADKTIYTIDQEAINEEAKYDGLYAVCTNLEDDVKEIIKVNQRRWEIEESFRIMKSEFNARPIFHSTEDAIKAHFLICFLSLTIYRYLEKKLDEKYTIEEILDTLKNMNLKLDTKNYYSPNYIRTDLTDDLHEKFGFRTDFEAIQENKLRKICKETKK